MSKHLSIIHLKKKKYQNTAAKLQLQPHPKPQKNMAISTHAPVFLKMLIEVQRKHKVHCNGGSFLELCSTTTSLITDSGAPYMRTLTSASRHPGGFYGHPGAALKIRWVLCLVLGASSFGFVVSPRNRTSQDPSTRR